MSVPVSQMVLMFGLRPRACLLLWPARHALKHLCLRLLRRFFLEAAVGLLVDVLLSILVSDYKSRLVMVE